MERYKINRIGVLNYWLYDEEEFYFYDGKLLLRGTNGSGKSVTMVSFFPLLFDGNKNPERFDTFGSRDRKVEDYVLPPTFDGNENTSYLYMEFYNKEKDNYITIGIGLRAIRNRNVEFYGFAITDNRRIKHDFALYKDRLRKIPLTKRELQTEIGSGGIFVTSSKEYKTMVNNLLFGFEQESLYSELINLMLQLRSPKLSKDYKPTKLEEILSSVLEPLNEFDLATISESIENMNKFKEKINDLTIENTAIRNLTNSFREYSDIVLYNKAKDYKETLNINDKLKSEKNEAEKSIIELKDNIEKCQKRIEEIKLALENTNYKITNLDAKDLNKLIEDKHQYETELSEVKNKQAEKLNAVEIKDAKKIALEKDIRKEENNIYDLEKELKQKYEDLNELAEEMHYDELLFYLDELKEQKGQFNFSYLFKDLENFKKKITELLKYVKTKDDLIAKKDEENQRINKLENTKNEIDKEKKNITQKLLKEVDNLKDKIYNLKNNEVYNLEEEDITAINEIIDSLDNTKSHKINDILNNRYQEIFNTLTKEINIINQKIDKESFLLENLNQERTKISNVFEKDLEPNETKKYLIDANLDVKYLYEVIEFKEEIPQAIREKIEKSLKRMGLLNTFLVKNIPSNLDIKTFSNLVEKNNTIAKYFNIVDNNFKKEALEVLNSISTSEKGIKISEDGTYELGIIKGRVYESYELKYIGQNTRDKYLERLYAQVDLKINNSKNILKDLQEKLEKAKNSIVILKKEYIKDFPLDIYNQEIINLKEYDIKEKLLINSINEIIENINIIDNEIVKIDTIIETVRNHYKGLTTKEKLEEVLNIHDEVKETILTIKTLLTETKGKEEMLLNFKNNLEETLISIDEINGDIAKYNYDIENINNKIKLIEEKKESSEFKNILEELEKLTEQKKKLDQEKEQSISSLATNQKELEIASVNIDKINQELAINEEICRIKNKIFMDEYNLKYTNYTADIDSFNKWFKDFKISKELSINQASEKILESMNNYLPKLQNYAGRKTNILIYEEKDIEKYITNEANKEMINSIFTNARRIDIEFRYSGKLLNVIDLNNALELELETTKNLLNEEDRKLFEDLLINNVGDSIRKKIAASNAWIKQVKDLMESMNTSSGLSFSIKWSGKNKENEEELDTKEIVDIFEREPITLKEEDLKKITNHFRSKISIEEEKYEDNERNYLEIIRNVLDYRKWYEFKLYFKRPNTEKKELTDKEFSKFSGGEKAIAMYIPLFSGIYAKFNSAKKDAPRIIALDEAFAGVDDDNILDCFRIMGEMDLDYVMTSQVLWGDYSTVKKLAICELHHLPSSDVVSIIRYKWDGLKRSLMTDIQEYKD